MPALAAQREAIGRAPEQRRRPMDGRTIHVLFVCGRNAAGWQIAEALLAPRRV